MTESRRRNAWIIGSLLLGASLTVVAVAAILSGGTAAVAPAQSAELELFTEKERIRDRDWPPLKSAAQVLESRIPDREGDADRLIVLQKLAQGCGARVVSASFTPPVAIEDSAYRLVVVQATVTGSLDKVNSWLAAVERSERLILIESLSLSRGTEGVAIRGDVQLGFPQRAESVNLKPYKEPLREE